MAATWEHESMPGDQREEVGGVESEEKALRKCTVCGTEFEGDPKVSLPVCPECQKPPVHPEGVPL